MQLVFQIPIIDLRPTMQTGEIISVWPSADMSKTQVEEFMKKGPFIRNFGKISSSPEGYCCNINCVKYIDLHKNGFLLDASANYVFNSYKHLYADSIYTAKAELGFSDQLEALITSTGNSKPVYIADILQHYMSVPIDVLDMGNMAAINTAAANGSDVSNWIKVKLGDIGPLLASNYYHATTLNKVQPAANEYVLNGEVCITLTYAANDKVLLPANAKKMDELIIDGSTVQIYGYKWSSEAHTFKVWLFELPQIELFRSPAVAAELQKRRANLFRLNAEKESMRILLSSFNAEKVNPALKNYLKKTPLKIFKKERFSAPQNSVRNFALQSNKDNIQFATIDDLKKVLDEYGLANLKNLEQTMKTAPPKKSILFITSNPTDSNPIDFGEQFKKISEAWQSGSDRDYFTVLNIESGVERDKVMEILYTKTPDYLHITLHASEIKGLYFQDSAKKPDPIPAEEFADYIKQLTELKPPEAVILCACNSLAHATAIQQYCKYAVGTNYVFPDDAAIVYAKKFYTALFNGKEVRFCHSVAVQGIKYYKPPFDAIDDIEVYNIPQLISANQLP